MEPFVVSARKYRPQSFKDVVGQSAITDTLLNAIENNHLAQALLFCGPRGVGKTTCARILAKKINEDGTQQGNEDFAFNIFELDAASNNSVDDIRSLTDQVRIPPQVGKYKVYIIDEVHMLTQSAFNAFLKTLEEPPKHVIFILATTEKHKIIPTILSRCQIFDFKRITIKDAAGYLKYIAEEQGIEAENSALHIIAQKADGAMRDALSIFDRVVSFSGKQLTRKAVTENLNVLDYEVYFEVTDLLLANDIPNLLLLFNKTLSLGFDGQHFINGLASHLRDLLVCQHPETVQLLEVGEDAKEKYAAQSATVNKIFLIASLDLANSCSSSYKSSKNQRLLVELCLMKMASLTFSEEKKNADFIVPASFFNAENRIKKPQLVTPEPQPPEESKIEEPSSVTQAAAKLESGAVPEEKPTAIPEPNEVQQTTASENIQKPKPIVEKQNAVVENRITASPKIAIDSDKKGVSQFSLSSIKAQKAHIEAQPDKKVHEELPNTPFTEEEMRKHWNDFVHQLDQKGRKILASNLQTDEPKMKDATTIGIELPNSTMKKEVEREQSLVLDYLKEKLDNYLITLQIVVNEEVAKKYAFTPEEKYQKLKEKNPAIDLLRQEFDLDF